MSGPRQLALDFEIRPAFGGADFLVADCNREAVAWIDRWPDWPSPCLIIHGPEGCGKSHLAEVFRRRAQAETLRHAALAGAEARDPAAAGGGWIVEDADIYLGAAPPEPLFHLFNQVREGGGGLLLTGRNAPALWPVELPDLRSRLNASAAVAIGPPDDELLAAVLVKLFADRQLRVGADVVDYAVKRMERSFAAVRDLVGRLDELSLTTRREITVPLARRAFRETECGPAGGRSG